MILVSTIFFVFVFALVVRAFILRFTEPKNIVPEPVIENILSPLHEHRWSQVTEFMRQCRERTCARIEFNGDVPDGFREYAELMTTRQARQHPFIEASFYREKDSRAWGLKCPDCSRVIGGPEGLPCNPFNPAEPFLVCPYCQILLRFEENEWKKDEPNHN